MPVEHTQDYWDELYRQQSQIWSGRPNGHLVAETENLRPGRALDVGCGEGADAEWLALRGWDVLAIDISEVALSRARARAARLDAHVAARITWRQVDLLSRPQLPTDFALVSIQFMHLPEPERSRVFGQLAALVAPGGSLLVVAHDPSDLHTDVGRPAEPEIFYTAQQVADSLGDSWDVVACESRPRVTRTEDGAAHAIKDAVLHAVRVH
jgi:SAM-dependent methyltransferase